MTGPSASRKQLDVLKGHVVLWEVAAAAQEPTRPEDSARATSPAANRQHTEPEMSPTGSTVRAPTATGSNETQKPTSTDITSKTATADSSKEKEVSASLNTNGIEVQDDPTIDGFIKNNIASSSDSHPAKYNRRLFGWRLMLALAIFAVVFCEY